LDSVEPSAVEKVYGRVGMQWRLPPYCRRPPDQFERESYIHAFADLLSRDAGVQEGDCDWMAKSLEKLVYDGTKKWAQMYSYEIADLLNIVRRDGLNAKIVEYIRKG
jgi:hypothetical protein